MASAAATPRQTAYLWGFSVKYRADKQSIQWNELANDGKLNKFPCIKLISALKDWEDHKQDPIKQAMAQKMLQEYDPGFRFAGGPAEPKVVDIEPQKAPLEKLPYDDLELWSALDKALHQNLYARTLTAFNELEDKLKEKAAQGYSDIELPDGTDYIKPEIFNRAYAILMSGSNLNLLIDGPAGCGKSRMGREMAKAKQVPFTAISMSGGVRYSQVFGGSQLVVDAKGKQKTEFVEGPLLKAIQEPGVVSIEEIFAADPDVLLGLNSILESADRQINTPKGVIKVHPECCIMATANTNGRSISAQFTGAQRADDSLNDRFVSLHMDYDLEVEAQILKGIENEDVRSFVKAKLALLRQKCRANNISFDPSTRRLISCMKCLQAGLSAEEAFDAAFLSHLSKAEKAKVSVD